MVNAAQTATTCVAYPELNDAFQRTLLANAYQLSRTCSQASYQKTREQFFRVILQPNFPIPSCEIDAAIRRLDIVGAALQNNQKCKLECLGVYVYIKSIFAQAFPSTFTAASAHEDSIETTHKKIRSDLPEMQNMEWIENNLFDVNQEFELALASGMVVTTTVFKFVCDQIIIDTSKRSIGIEKLMMMFRAGANINLKAHQWVFWDKRLFLDIDLLREALLSGLNVNLGRPSLDVARSGNDAVSVTFRGLGAMYKFSMPQKYEDRLHVDQILPPNAAAAFIGGSLVDMKPMAYIEIAKSVHGLRLALFFGLKINQTQRLVLEKMATVESTTWMDRLQIAPSVRNNVLKNLWIERFPQTLDRSPLIKEEAEKEYSDEFRRGFTSHVELHQVFGVAALVPTFFSYAKDRVRLLEIYEARYSQFDKEAEASANKDKATAVEINGSAANAANTANAPSTSASATTAAKPKSKDSDSSQPNSSK